MHEFCLPPYFGLILFLIILSTEAIIEIIKNSDISLHLIHKPIISLYERYDSVYTYTLHKYITCGQCMSVVYSIPGSVALTTYIHLNNEINIIYTTLIFIVLLFSIQRSTNWLNSSYKLLYRGRISAIQIIDPVEFRDMSRVNMNDKDFILNRELFKHKPAEVIINNLSDIKTIISKLKASKPQDGNDVSISIDNHQFKLSTSTNHPTYMNMIVDMLSENNQDDVVIPINDNESIVASRPQLGGNVGSLINRLTGGVKEYNRIRWDIGNDVYYYDPVFDVLTKSDND